MRQAADIGVDGVKRGLEKRRLHLPQHVHHMRRAMGLDQRAAAVELVGEQVVGHHRLTPHAERVEQQRGGETGAVLASGAVEHHRRGLLQQVAEKTRIGGRSLGHKGAVGLAHQFHRLGLGRHLTAREEGLHAHHHGGLDRERHGGGTRHRAGQGGALCDSPEVQAVREPQGLQRAVVVGREAGEVVGAEDLTGAHAPAVQTGVAAEVAEVGSALQNGRGERGSGDHGWALSVPPR